MNPESTPDYSTYTEPLAEGENAAPVIEAFREGKIDRAKAMLLLRLDDAAADAILTARAQ